MESSMADASSKKTERLNKAVRFYRILLRISLTAPGAYRFRLLARLGRDQEFGEAWSQVF